MSTLIVAAQFTKNTGQPAQGLALADIDLYLTRLNNSTGVDTVVWNGTQHPTEEVDNCGTYMRRYTSADLSVFSYYVAAHYTGAVVLDTDYAMGAISEEATTFPAGAIEYTYTVTDSGTGLPIEGVEVWFATDLAGTNIVWKGDTDAFGIARDVHGSKPWLDAGTYYVWKQFAGYVDNDGPDIEVVS